MVQIKVYMHYLKLKDFMEYQPIMVRTSFSSQDDIETFIRLKDVFMQKQQSGILIRRRKPLEKLFFWKKSI